jgi:hypothetical protein
VKDKYGWENTRKVSTAEPTVATPYDNTTAEPTVPAPFDNTTAEPTVATPFHNTTEVGRASGRERERT